MQLTDREWKEFYIGGENGLFELKSTSSGVDKNKLNSASGDIPYITRTDGSNGIDLFVNDKQNDKYKIDMNNVITIGLDTQTVFYQPHKFYTGQNIQVLSNAYLNQYNAKFICRLLKIQLKKYNWGGNGATLGRLKRAKIMLPVNKNSDPDYVFMDAYVKEQENRKKQEYIDYAKKVLAKLEYKEVKALKEKTYGEFKVFDLFNYKRGNQNNMNLLIEGNNMLISAKNISNGLKGFYKSNNDKKTVYQGDCITLNNDGDGGVGLAYYQPNKFLLDTHVYALYSKTDINKYSKLYITLALSKQRICFSHGRSISKERLEKMKIMLPISEKNQPDYAYMEQYIKNIEYKKITQYLDYLSSNKYTAS